MMALSISAVNEMAHFIMLYVFPGFFVCVFAYAGIEDLKRNKIEKEIKSNGLEAEADIINVYSSSAVGWGIVNIVIELNFTAANGQSISAKKGAHIFLSELGEFKAKNSISIKYHREKTSEIILLEMPNLRELRKKTGRA